MRANLVTSTQPPTESTRRRTTVARSLVRRRPRRPRPRRPRRRRPRRPRPWTRLSRRLARGRSTAPSSPAPSSSSFVIVIDDQPVGRGDECVGFDGRVRHRSARSDVRVGKVMIREENHTRTTHKKKTRVGQKPESSIDGTKRMCKISSGGGGPRVSTRPTTMACCGRVFYVAWRHTHTPYHRIGGIFRAVCIVFVTSSRLLFSPAPARGLRASSSSRPDGADGVLVVVLVAVVVVTRTHARRKRWCVRDLDFDLDLDEKRRDRSRARPRERRRT